MATDKASTKRASTTKAKAATKKAAAKPPGHAHRRKDNARRLTYGQSEFLIVCAARFATPDETVRQWKELWPDSPVPDRATIFRYRPQEVYKHPKWAAIFHAERERFLEDCDNLPFSHRKLRYRALCQLAQKLYEMLESPPDIDPTWAKALGLTPAWGQEMRQEIGTKTKDGYVKRTAPTQADVRREFYQVIDQIEQMVGSRGSALKERDGLRIRIPAGTTRKQAAQIAAEAMAARLATEEGSG
jgi:hypothetical protein